MKTIALFENHPECSRQCCEGMHTSLLPNYNIRLFGTYSDIESVLSTADIVAFPGGIGDADTYYDFFKRRHGNAVANFVERGGYYLGICMGAYWAGPDYFDILDRIKPVQYIKRDTADIRRPYGTVAKVDWLCSEQHMFFYDGCTFIGEQDGDGPVFDVYGRYANHDPMAIIQGRVGLIGCHPESQQFWYEDKYKYINRYWHEGKHNQLLLEFVNKLTNN